MSLWKIAWRSIQQRSLASLLTAVSMGLGVTLMVAVIVIGSSVGSSFIGNAGNGYNMVVGAKGGKLQLVLNTVYHLSQPVENIPYSYYKQFTPGGEWGPYVAKAVPCCMGDYHEGFRVIGTTPAYLEPIPGGIQYEFAAGRNYKPSEFFGAVIGSVVAEETGLGVGDTFAPTHAAPEDGHVHEEKFDIVGVLAPTGTPNDQALFINIEGFYLLDNHAKPVKTLPPASADSHDHAGHDHDHEGHEHDAHPAGEGTAGPAGATTTDEHDHDHAGHDHADHGHDHAGHDHGHDHSHHGHSHAPLPEEQREVTSILLRTFDPSVAPDLVNTINEGEVAQAVSPVGEISKLFQVIVRPMQLVLLLLTGLIIIVSAISILVGMYNSMSERKHEIAVMRALGAGRNTVMSVVLLESVLLSLLGGLAGWAFGHFLVGVLSPTIQRHTGVYLGFFEFVPQYELILIPALMVLAALAGFLPALAAYRTDVAKSLTANP